MGRSSGMPASAALEVSWATQRDGPRQNGSEFLCAVPGSPSLRLSRRLAGPRHGRELQLSPPTHFWCDGQDGLMIKTCFYTINYVLCKQRVAEDWIWRVWRTITGTITQTTARHHLQLNMRMPALLTPHLLSIVPLQLCVYSSGIISLQLKIVKPKSSPKNKSEIHVPNPKSKVQRKGTGTGADNIIIEANPSLVDDKEFLKPSPMDNERLWWCQTTDILFIGWMGR